MSVSFHIIEADMAVRDGLCELLALDGHAAFAYDSHENFFNAPAPHPSDVISLDIAVPIAAGLEAARRLKLTFPENRIVLISDIRLGLLARVIIAVKPVATFRKPIDGAAFANRMRGLAADT